jgi:transcriptional regulator with XRE-family HTH domain
MARKKPKYTTGTIKKLKVIKMAKATAPEDHKLFNKMAMRKYRKFIKDLAAIVIKRRKILKMSRDSLANRIGIHVNTMFKFENEGKVGADTLFQICTYLDIDFKIVPKSMVGEKKYWEFKEHEEVIMPPEPELKPAGEQVGETVNDSNGGQPV